MKTPYIEFLDATGLDAPYFATFRKGRQWSLRVKKGQTVFLAHDFYIIGKAKVDLVECGRASEILKQFAAMSHMEIAEQLPGAAKRRMESLTRIYGPARFNDDSLLTVIFLKLIR